MQIFLNRVFGAAPTDDDLDAYLEAYFGDRLSKEHRNIVISNLRKSNEAAKTGTLWYDDLVTFVQSIFGLDNSQQDTFVQSIFGLDNSQQDSTTGEDNLLTEAQSITSLLIQSTEELTSVVAGLNGGYIKPAPGGGKNTFWCLWFFNFFILKIYCETRLVARRT